MSESERDIASESERESQYSRYVILGLDLATEAGSIRPTQV